MKDKTITNRIKILLYLWNVCWFAYIWLTFYVDYMFFTYIDSGAPLLRPQFETKYSVAYKMDINENWTYWINQQYAQYFGFDLIWGVPREEWTEY